MAKSRINPDLQKALTGMDKAYISGSKEWFNYLSDDVIVYSNISGDPFKGKVAYMEHFEKSLISSKRKMEILSRNVQTIGEISIVYQTVQIVQDNIVVSMKQSQVWRATESGWKVNHLHSAIIGQPQSINPSVKKVGAINVINEKIASMAAVMGVAQ
jgi:hypothetical protein